MSLIKIRRGTAAELSGITLALGEIGYCTDTKQIYIGNGISNTWVASPVLDQDDLSSDSNTSLATQQSLKKYIDTNAVGVPDRLGITGSTVTNWNTIVEAGFYKGSPGLNAPTAVSGTLYHGLVTATSSNHVLQELTSFVSGSDEPAKTYRRGRDDGTWSDWERVIMEEDQLDTRYEPLGAPNASGVPVGTIVAWVGGYWTTGSNAGYTRVLGTANTAAAVNTLLNSEGWYVCDGAVLNTGEGIFNGASRYLPNLTDDRFIMGDSWVGSTGGDNAMSHTHTGAAHTHTISNHVHSTGNMTLTTTHMPSHRHTSPAIAAQAGTGGYSYFNYLYSYPTWNDQTLYSNYTGGGSTHNHGNTGTTTNPASGARSASTSSEASNTENRPKFLGCFYIMKVI